MANEFVPCRKCIHKGKVPGYIESPLEHGQVAVTECECHAKWRKENLLKVIAKKANIWCTPQNLAYDPEKDYKGTLSTASVNKLIYFVDNFHRDAFKASSLYMWGPNGTQKTHLAQWVGLTLLRKGFTIKYMSMQSFVKKISDLEDSEEKETFILDLLDLDLLILDEAFNKQKVTVYKSGFQLPFIEDFLKERIEGRQKSCIFISNTKVEDISINSFSDSIQNFVIRNTKDVGTCLEFMDNYFNSISDIDINSIFKGL